MEGTNRMSVMGTPLEAITVEPGTSLLISGPTLTGKRRLLYELLASAPRRRERATILTTTRKRADTIAREYEAVSGGGDGGAGRAERSGGSDELAIVDCVGRLSGFDPDREQPNRRYVSSPGDLTGVGIAVTEFMRRQYEAGTETRVGVHSLSTMLMYTELRRLFQFLHVLTGRIANCEFSGVFVADDDVVDDRDFAILKQPFDAVLELRETDDGREYRIRGEYDGPRRWTTLDTRF
ncbi:hypothetical protein AUR64_00385 [Haloprofundus marisrubri]|uniref:Recombinase RecA n=1 Tax=Haloprofundus marisrubri TaxID=1514971 RepID=A0A0W1RGA4_9EURY|nr:hypothetical protein [Haloprofundus marisrubri]KTG11684.1 hypothetical protein AUR64_00385 [Haloprofundus marisrubri]